MIEPLLFIILLTVTGWILISKDIVDIAHAKRPFACTDCGKCCKYIVELKKKDIARIKAAGKTNFTKRNLWLITLRQKDGYCMFYKFEGGKSFCSIYESRPDICRKFPQRRIFNVLPAQDSRCPVIMPEKWSKYIAKP